jgi:hypothetical protein
MCPSASTQIVVAVPMILILDADVVAIVKFNVASLSQVPALV